MFKKVIIYEKNTEPPKDYIWVRGENLDETVEWNGTEWTQADATVVLPGAKGEGGQASNIDPNTVFETDDCVAIKLKNGHVVSYVQYTAEGHTIEDVQGIACRSTDLNMGICLGLNNAAEGIQFGYINDDLSWATYKLSDAVNDFTGSENTTKLLEIDSTSNFAAVKASEYVFPDGTNAWLPSLGELTIIGENKDAVDSLISSLGSGDSFGNYFYWSSTPSPVAGSHGFNAWGIRTDTSTGISGSSTSRIDTGRARVVCQL